MSGKCGNKGVEDPRLKAYHLLPPEKGPQVDLLVALRPHRRCFSNSKSKRTRLLRVLFLQVECVCSRRCRFSGSRSTTVSFLHSRYSLCWRPANLVVRVAALGQRAHLKRMCMQTTSQITLKVGEGQNVLCVGKQVYRDGPILLLLRQLQMKFAGARGLLLGVVLGQLKRY